MFQVNRNLGFILPFDKINDRIIPHLKEYAQNYLLQILAQVSRDSHGKEERHIGSPFDFTSNKKIVIRTMVKFYIIMYILSHVNQVRVLYVSNHMHILSVKPNSRFL